MQEALSNIARHSSATRASVQVAFQPEGVQIEVRDNGSGFLVPCSPAEFAPSGHLGLLGMFERADLVGAKILIDSEPDSGTRLIMRIPKAKQKLIASKRKRVPRGCARCASRAGRLWRRGKGKCAKRCGGRALVSNMRQGLLNRNAAPQDEGRRMYQK